MRFLGVPRSSLQKTGWADSSRREARATQSSREVGGSFHKKNILKLAHSNGSPGNFFVRKEKTSDRGANQKKRDGADNCVSEEGKTTSVEDGRGVLSMNKNLKLPQTGGSPGIFPARNDKTICQGGGSNKKNSGGQEHPRGSCNNKFWSR